MLLVLFFFFSKQKTAYEMRISDWSSDVCSSDLLSGRRFDPPAGPAGYKRSLSTERRPYLTRDGHICVMVYNDKQWRSLFEALGEPEKCEQDRRFSSQGARLEHIDEVYGFKIGREHV